MRRELLVDENASQPLRKQVGVAPGDEQTGLAVADDGPQPTHTRRHDRRTARQRLHRYQPERLVAGGHHRNVRCRVVGRQLLVRNRADKSRPIANPEPRRQVLQAADSARYMAGARSTAHDQQLRVEVGETAESAQQHFQSLEPLDAADEQDDPWLERQAERRTCLASWSGLEALEIYAT